MAVSLVRLPDPISQGVIDRYFELLHRGPAKPILGSIAAATLVLALPTSIAWTRGSNSLWRLRWLRLAAMVSMFSNALVDFAVEGFSALITSAKGLTGLAVVSRNFITRAADRVGHPIADDALVTVGCALVVAVAPVAHADNVEVPAAATADGRRLCGDSLPRASMRDSRLRFQPVLAGTLHSGNR